MRFFYFGNHTVRFRAVFGAVRCGFYSVENRTVRCGAIFTHTVRCGAAYIVKGCPQHLLLVR